MKPENLEMHIALQPLYKKMMGEWQDGDRYFLPNIKVVDVFCPYCIIGQTLLNRRAIRLPLPINPVNPERGLWGMVDWKKGNWKLTYTGYGGVELYNQQLNLLEKDIEEALLKALLEQEGL